MVPLVFKVKYKAAEIQLSHQNDHTATDEEPKKDL